MTNESKNYWTSFMLGASGLIVLLYLGKKLATPATLQPPQQPKP